ncbi:MAG: SpoIID/LytB domain-containing protein [Bacteroidales bacterium]|jgi:stage II sporulation protein D
MLKKLLISLLIILPFISNASRVRVRILSGTDIASMFFIPVSNNYEIFSDTNKIYELSKADTLFILVENKFIKLKAKNGKIGVFEKIYLKKKGFMNNFKIKSLHPESKEFMFDDDLEISVIDNKKLLLINNVDINYYVAGVMEAEGGRQANMEFYKVQAILCRTFVMSHYRRHEKEGYNVCDKVHCQVYRGRCKQSNILMAALSTKGMVIASDSNNLIIASYHSNCGGQTVNSEDVWSKKISYLRSVKDSFCVHSSNAFWTKKISVKDWEKYLLKKYKLTPKDSLHKNVDFSFHQPHRKVFLYDSTKINLREIRTDWNLKSTFFEITRDGDNLIFKGRGFGHGIGLCQEGAMKMSKLGYNFRGIINHYFTNVKIVYQDIPK